MLLCSGLIVHATEQRFLRDTRGTPLIFASHGGNSFVIRDMSQRYKIDKTGGLLDDCNCSLAAGRTSRCCAAFFRSVFQSSGFALIL
jgi:hypothetical protein